MNWISIIFWILFGLYLPGWFTFAQEEVVLGLLALVIGIAGLIAEIRKQP